MIVELAATDQCEGLSVWAELRVAVSFAAAVAARKPNGAEMRSVPDRVEQGESECILGTALAIGRSDFLRAAAASLTC